MRFNDTLHIVPEDMHFKNEALVITVYASKTTGPGKKVELLYVIISVCAYIAEDSWLKRGMELMKEMGSGISRDCLLPLPEQDKFEFRKAPAQYHHVLCMSRALLGGLHHCTCHPAKGWWS